MASNNLRRRLVRAESSLPGPAPAPPTVAADDSGELARELAEAFGSMLRYYRQHAGLTPEEARGRAAEAPEGFLDRVLSGPPDQVTWDGLDLVAQRDEEKMLARWEEVKE